ncbi:TRAP transporter small permease [Pseudomonas stutzeri]|uniref:TRAP transporter small permease n=1 Tax=Stutzerimonas stutzeri TaxID=316 RepID=UPI0021098088|nr:TRAP transporter small permease [Stutzerimonas stutzeri]MCQ4314309.1 TRAP transporter small permease [Stutzerimonas stutzeri]
MSSKVKCFDGLIMLSGIVAGIAAFFIGISVTYDVVARSVFGATTNWVTDVNTYIVAFITFVGAAYAQREGAHVGVDIVTTRLPPKLRGLALSVSNVIVVLVVGLLLWLGCEQWLEIWVSGEQSAGMFTVPLWIPFSSLPIGMLLLLAVQLRNTFRCWLAPSGQN